MKIEIGKTYLTKNGKEILITKEVFNGVFFGESECGWTERYTEDGKNWNYWFGGDTFSDPRYNIIGLSLFSK